MSDRLYGQCVVTETLDCPHSDDPNMSVWECPECPETFGADPVNSPAHYTWLGGIEVIDITEHLGFCLGNVVKYVTRADHKGKPLEDLKKARWYLDREISRRESTTEAT